MKKSKESSTPNGSTKFEVINKFWFEEIKIHTEILTHIPEENEFFELCFKIQRNFLLTVAKLAQDTEFRSALIELQKSEKPTNAKL